MKSVRFGSASTNEYFTPALSNSAWQVVRDSSPTDRRAWILRLTREGRRSFEAMAHEHEQWILELFDGLDASAVQQLHAHLGALRAHVARDG